MRYNLDVHYDLQAEQDLLNCYCDDDGSIKDDYCRLMYVLIKAHQKIGDGYYNEAIESLLFVAKNIPYFVKHEEHKWESPWNLDDSNKEEDAFIKKILKGLK